MDGKMFGNGIKYRSLLREAAKAGEVKEKQCVKNFNSSIHSIHFFV